MPLSLNQFLQTVEVGFCDRNTSCFNPIPVVVGDSIAVGDAVSLATNVINTIPKVVSAIENSIFGFIFIHTHENYYIVNDKTDILPLGSGAIIYLKAGSLINSGDLLAYDISTKTINTVTESQQIIGQALIGAAASGDVIPVYLNQPCGKIVTSEEQMAVADLENITELYRGEDE